MLWLFKTSSFARPGSGPWWPAAACPRMPGTRKGPGTWTRPGAWVAVGEILSLFLFDLLGGRVLFFFGRGDSLFLFFWGGVGSCFCLLGGGGRF